MTAQIKLKKLTGIKVGSDTIDTSNSAQFKTKVDGLSTGKLVFAGQDYKGTLDNSGQGTLELYLEGPENYFKIEGVKVKNSSSNHSYDGKKDATIDIIVSSPKITEKDSGWFTTQLDLKGFTAADSSLKFGEWNDYNLPDKCYVDISFS